MTDEAILEEWIVAVASAYKLAYVERLRTLSGDRTAKTTTFDVRMMHPFSEMLGRATAMESFLPELAVLELHPMAVRREAERDAHDTFVRTEAEKLGLG